MSSKNQTTIGVTGMTCAACSTRIEKVLNKMDGVEAQVNLTTEKATIEFDSEKAGLNAITEKIENMGYGVLTEKAELDITGMTCAACSTRIEKVLNKQEGVKAAVVNLTTESATVEFNPSVTDESNLIKKIRNIGYDAKPKAGTEEKQSSKEKQLHHMKTKLIISALLSAPLL